MNKKSGFTLAEVLVTLMIIGVIASMTVPSLMQSTAQQEYKSALKKAASTLNQAITMNYALDGVDASDYTGASFLDLLTKRLNVSEKGTDYVYTADGMHYKVSPTGGNCNQNSEDVNDLSTPCATVQVDVNGKKGPNKLTTTTAKVMDIYTFKIYPQKVLPARDIDSQVMYMK